MGYELQQTCTYNREKKKTENLNPACSSLTGRISTLIPGPTDNFEEPWVNNSHHPLQQVERYYYYNYNKSVTITANPIITTTA